MKRPIFKNVDSQIEKLFTKEKEEQSYFLARSVYVIQCSEDRGKYLILLKMRERPESFGDEQYNREFN